MPRLDPLLRGETRAGAWNLTEGKDAMIHSTEPCQNCTMTVEYMGAAEVAAYVTRVHGRPIAGSTIRQYAAKGRMPEPDVRVGPVSGWSAKTIDEWVRTRPGQGARTDLAGSKGTK